MPTLCVQYGHFTSRRFVSDLGAMIFALMLQGCLVVLKALPTDPTIALAILGIRTNGLGDTDSLSHYFFPFLHPNQ